MGGGGVSKREGFIRMPQRNMNLKSRAQLFSSSLWPVDDQKYHFLMGSLSVQVLCVMDFILAASLADTQNLNSHLKT